jgi:archaellum biogenesis ATPase FlaH
MQLLSAVIADKGAYDIAAPYITDRDLTPPVQFWWELIKEWYNRDPASRFIDRDVLSRLGEDRIKNPKHRDTLLGAIRDAGAVGSPSNVAVAVLELKRHNVGHDLAAAIVAKDTEKVNGLLPLYNELLTATSLRRKATREDARDWTELDEVVGTGNRVFVAPRKLNDRLAGGALPGHHIVVFGRPEVGKSTFAINAVAGFLHHKQRVLYIGNEDNINVIKARTRNRLADMTPEQVDANKAEANRRAAEKADGRLSMVHLHKGTMDDVEREIEKIEPTVVILDQIRNVEAKADGLTQKLEMNGQAFRRILSTYNIIGMSITQAYPGDHNRPPKIWLDMDDIESSRTGLPGTADLIVGVGGDDAMLARNQRALSLSKNKLSSAPNAHEGVIVEFDKGKAKVI